MNNTVLVTGANGYLGGRIAQYLDFSDVYKLRLAVFEDKSGFTKNFSNSETVLMNILSDSEVKNVCKNVRCVIHLAALNELACASDPEGALLVNVLGTLKLLRAAEESRVERFIYLSTAHVYGSPLQGVITEKTLPKPVHPYAITHRVAEDFVLASSSGSKMQGICIRLSNALGSPVHPLIDRWSLLVNDLCRQVVSSGKIQLHSSGLQERDFISIKDVCAAIQFFIESPRDSLGDGLYNLGGDRSWTIIDMAAAIASRCQAVLGFLPSIMRPDVQFNEKNKPLVYSVDKLKKIGFKLEANIIDAIDETLLFCMKHFGDKDEKHLE
jgi:UDP-glucose 4-epimerase